jgi:hypothetical protein
MGRFVADIQNIHDTFERVTFTADGILWLAGQGYLCKVKRCEIEDKSKADKFAKGLVCIQVAWVIGQAIERKVGGYPITLLEIHSMVHAVCALLMYGLWFQKPLEIHAPTVLNFEGHLDLLAFVLQVPGIIGGYVTNHDSSWEPFWRRSLRYKYRAGPPDIVWHGNSEHFERNINHVNSDSLELSSLNRANSVSIKTICCFVSADNEGVQRQFLMNSATPNSPYYRSCKGGLACILSSGQTLENGLWPPIPRSWYTEQRVHNAETPVFTAELSGKEVKRLDLVKRFLERINFRQLCPSKVEEDNYVGLIYPSSRAAFIVMQ